MMIADLEPDMSTCRECVEFLSDMGINRGCNECSINKRECQIVSVGSRAFGGDYAIILIDGRLEKVPMSRLCNVREKD